jgi:hypothetical protein
MELALFSGRGGFAFLIQILWKRRNHVAGVKTFGQKMHVEWHRVNFVKCSDLGILKYIIYKLYNILASYFH